MNFRVFLLLQNRVYILRLRSIYAKDIHCIHRQRLFVFSPPRWRFFFSSIAFRIVEQRPFYFLFYSESRRRRIPTARERVELRSQGYPTVPLFSIIMWLLGTHLQSIQSSIDKQPPQVGNQHQEETTQKKKIFKRCYLNELNKTHNYYYYLSELTSEFVQVIQKVA